MKLKEIETFLVGTPPPYFGGRYFMFVKLTTSNGIVGYGEIYAGSISPQLQLQIAADLFERYFYNNSPFNVENFFRKCHSSGYSQRPDPTLMGAFSALEMACWDILGKALNQPVHNLLGGLCHEKLRAYTYLYPTPEQDPTTFYNNAEQSAQCAAKYIAQGFTAIKFDPAGAYTAFDPHQPSLEIIEQCVQFCKTIRAAIGTQADLLFGTHGQFTPAAAIRLAQHLENFSPLWFEEPTPPEMPEALAQVARATTIPIATGERLTTKYEFARLLQCQAAAILQPALGRVGGILEAKKIASLAEPFYVQIAPHLYCGPVEALANIQFACSTPNFLILEIIENFGGFHNELLTRPIIFENGYIIPSTNAGLGAELNEDVARANPYTEKKLHLEMKNVYNYKNERGNYDK